MPRPKKQHLVKRPDGRFRCKYKDQYFYGKTEDEALAARDEYKRREREQDFVNRQAVTVGKYASDWLPVHKASVKPSTFNSYVSIMEKITKPIEFITLSKITTDDIAVAYASIADKSASYIHKAKLLLTEILDSAVDAGYLKRNPCRASSVKAPKGTRGSHRALTAEEINLVLTTPHRMQAAAMVMLYAGLRRGEVLALSDADIDMKKGRITVSHAVYFDGNKPILSTTKSDAGRREVPILSPLRPHLAWVSGYLLNRDGELFTEQAFERAWESYMDALSRQANGGIARRWWGKTKEHKARIAAGEQLPPYKEISFRPHDLRHTFCTMLRDAGVDIHQAMIWMGHADEKLILRIYDHPGKEREADSKNAFETLIRGQFGGQTESGAV